MKNNKCQSPGYWQQAAAKVGFFEITYKTFFERCFVCNRHIKYITNIKLYKIIFQLQSNSGNHSCMLVRGGFKKKKNLYLGFWPKPGPIKAWELGKLTSFQIPTHLSLRKHTRFPSSEFWVIFVFIIYWLTVEIVLSQQ